MKKTVFFIGLITLLVACKENKTAKTETQHAKPVEKVKSGETYQVVDSKITWQGYKPTGSHIGTVDLKEGYLLVKDGKLLGGKFVIDMNTIKDLDMPETDPYNKKLVSHLKSPNFFYVMKYPTTTFEITNVQTSEDKVLVEGNLTIKGITKSIKFPAEFQKNDTEITFNSETIKIDRTDFGIKYKSKKFFDNLKDKFINDIFDISFKIQAKK